MNDNYLKKMESLSTTNTVKMTDGLGAKAKESMTVLLGTVLLFVVLGLGFVALKSGAEVAEGAYNKSPTLQQTLNTPVQIINEISK